MNPQFDPTPGLRLPEPSLDTRPVAPAAQPMNPTQPPANSQVQQATTQPQAFMQQPMQQPMQQVQPLPVAQASAPQPVVANTVEQTPAPQQAAPASDDDIDQQWINKAKGAVEQFHMDPYAESAALSKIKAEYLQTRHNIATKLGDHS